MNRLLAALVAYAAIAGMAWFTLTGEKIRFLGGAVEASPRDFVVVLMAAFAALTLLNHWKARQQEKIETTKDER